MSPPSPPLTLESSLHPIAMYTGESGKEDSTARKGSVVEPDPFIIGDNGTEIDKPEINDPKSTQYSGPGLDPKASAREDEHITLKSKESYLGTPSEVATPCSSCPISGIYTSSDEELGTRSPVSSSRIITGDQRLRIAYHDANHPDRVERVFEHCSTPTFIRVESSLTRVGHEGTAGSSGSRSSTEELDDPEKEYEVESVEGSRVRQGRKEYLVNWKGYEDCTWEPADNLKNAQLAIDEYRQRQPSRKRKRDEPGKQQTRTSRRILPLS
ncbi:hypothetical protein TWF481_003011 [Arthrobotrys musiformis]|uniref:Chromo domain-containing protein n=1 Tax=Arthrobotrys musiformis TaxID=47236 RepID=A0AAV9VUD1_9PEZI